MASTGSLHTAVIFILIVFAFLVSVVLEMAAGFASVGWDSGYPRAVHRALDMATLVWIISCCVASVLFFQVCRASMGGGNNDGSARLRSAAIAMMITGLAHIAAYLSFVLVLGHHSGYKPKAKPMGWLLVLVPGILWILAGHLSLQQSQVLDSTFKNDTTVYSQLPQETA